MFDCEGEVRAAITFWDFTVKVVLLTLHAVVCLAKLLQPFWQSAEMIAVALQDFDTVMKALSSNTERWGIFDVTLELKRYLSQAARESS